MFDMSITRRDLRAASCAALTAMLLASCGGGSSGSDTTATDASTSATGSVAGDSGITAAGNGNGNNGNGNGNIGSGSGSGTGTTTPGTGTTTPDTGTGTTTPGTGTTTPDTGTTTPTVTGPFGQTASAYELTFSDEFSGTSLNTAKWNDAIWYEGSNATKNYAVEDGKLKIWPQRDASGNFFNRTIDTDGKYYQTYGYFEMEAKLPVGRGTWPAFWLFNHDGAHPYRPEIDILEAYSGGGPNSGWSDANLHPTAYASTIWPSGIESAPYAGSKTFQNLGDLSAGFHKYGVKWEPGKQTFYFDGKEMFSVNVSMGSRMYIILDLWFGSASGSPDGSTPTGKTNSYEVNYVRAWKLK